MFGGPICCEICIITKGEERHNDKTGWYRCATGHDAGRAGIQPDVDIEPISSERSNFIELTENPFGLGVTDQLNIVVCEDAVIMVDHQPFKTVLIDVTPHGRDSQ